MDSVTQAALGATVGGAVLGRRLGCKAVILGALLGTLPDLDVMIDYGDAVANVTEHRGFSHSLFVLTGLAGLLALVSARVAPASDIPLARWSAFFGLVLITHPLLDALTTYGTQLFWPLESPPVAWPIVFIIDPFYSLTLLACLVIALLTRRVRHWCAWGLGISCVYLLLAFSAKLTVEHRLAPVLAEQGLEDAPILVQPTPFNILLWRATVVDGDRYHESLVSVFDRAAPPTLEPLRRGATLESVALDSRAGQRLAWFAGPFLRYEMRSIDGQLTLLATDLRLGFPGYHPFNFSLATRQNNAWQPVAISVEIASERDLDATTLSRLAARAAGNRDALCATTFVMPKWQPEPLALPCASSNNP
ncbi:metal-dependent hydrolase [Vreelandella janggokensis]|uniref:metal-dependent hydrolase n=1 Tax=Vreelandella janggokensis TaxID=370767 RepID=UPI00285A1455|nr:metal-dependent hydrolase [Halomonas janggokensis]MDR5887682.1 metal-dependent hydrolase [Halomonas janggokensis]